MNNAPPCHPGGVAGATSPPSYYEYTGPRGNMHHPEHSPQRRFLSEGELLRGNGDLGPPYRTNNTVDNIRELASSPQRGMYLWKDTSPSVRTPQVNTNTNQYEHFRSNPTSPTQRVYYPALRGGVQVFPPGTHQSPAVKRKANMPLSTAPPTSSQTIDNRRRPMSFVRALEMSEMSDIEGQQQRPTTTPTPDRQSVYDINYEISV